MLYLITKLNLVLFNKLLTILFLDVTSVELLNVTLNDGIFESEIFDFTAFGDVDFQNKSVEVFIPINGTVTVGYFNVLADDEQEDEEELFGIQLQSTGWDVDLSINHTANVTIAADNDLLCAGKSITSLAFFLPTFFLSLASVFPFLGILAFLICLEIIHAFHVLHSSLLLFLFLLSSPSPSSYSSTSPSSLSLLPYNIHSLIYHLFYIFD